jgi:Uma2 family endonuclease
MPAVILQPGEHFVELGEVRVPEWVVDLDSFLRWCDSDEFPEEGRIDYLKGEVWIDMSTEQVFTHNQAKTEFTIVVGSLVKRKKLGRYFTDGLRLSNLDADIAVVPDGSFVSNETMREANIKLVEGKEDGYTSIEGAPDMVLEIVSDSSVHKDTKRLLRDYWDAGIKEYWLEDVRGERLLFNIFRHTPKGYVAVRARGGWLKSQVFDKSFRLTRDEDEFGNPDYTLEVR